MIIGAWNVNSVNTRLERLKSFLTRVQPDVLCLQELKCTDEKFPQEDIEQLGYHCAFFGQKTYNGVAILSRHPIEDVVRSFGDRDDGQSRFISARVNGVRVMSAYIPNGKAVGSESYEYKLDWFLRLRTYLDTHCRPDEPLVLCGDFNVAPTDLDVHNPDAHRGQLLFSEQEKAALQHVLDFGLHDTLRVQHPTDRIYSWWDYRQLAFPKNHGWRIDFVFATAPLLSGLKRSWVERDERKGEKPSDHAPVLAEFGN